MILTTAIDWNTIVTSLIAIIPATLAAYWARSIHKAVKVPSGGTLGAVVDNTHGLAGITVAHTTELVKAEHERVSNGDEGHS